jgi:NPCBM/NEW2 domain-containing protein
MQAGTGRRMPSLTWRSCVDQEMPMKKLMGVIHRRGLHARAAQDLQPIETQLVSGAWTVKNVIYQHSLGASRQDLSCGGRADASYSLGGQYRRFRATAGLSDDAISGQVYFVVTLDSTEMYRESVVIGQPRVIDLAVTDGSRLEISIDSFSCTSKGAAVWGDARLVR